MSDYSDLSLTIAWWNTSLSPLGMERPDSQSKKTAENVVRNLIDDVGVDCLALGEVSSNDLLNLKKVCDSEHLGIIDGAVRQGRLKFDVGIIYSMKRFSLNDTPRSIISRYGRSALKIAYRIDFTITDTNEPLHIFVSHWPSRLYCNQNDTKRDTLGMDDKWYLNEETVKIWHHPLLAQLVSKSNENFDHFPVISVINRKILKR